MTDETPDTDAAPGSGAGDAAPTQEIPRIPKPVAKKAPARPAPAKSVPAKVPAAAAKRPAGPPSGATSTSAPTPVAPVTDKGRARPAPSPEKPQDPPVSKNAEPVTAAPEQKKAVPAAGGPTGRPLTAADYARTTKQSAAATAVIPAVKDDRPGTSKTAAPAPAETGGSTRRASLRLVRVEPWSVTRLAFAISVALMIVAVVAVAIFWVVLDATGVWGQINDSVTSVLSDDSSSFNITDYLGFGRLVGLTLVLSAINVLLTTALATIGAHLYNLASQLLGGVEVTFAEER